ncbi:uncharacterized protein [Parasteatoda tepidariorum]|uniref:uncharacterized protein n=1 Tax=Parasteatoda tepidariorum TaxID=114398 RepID=UPI001C71CEE9|nr:uncharacterized protein LOC107456208 [Parasteatoda tepidariorum]XP_042905680.1 uncharacterized protein LOC107456208 [Parasteatoda tepidariorum]
MASSSIRSRFTCLLIFCIVTYFLLTLYILNIIPRSIDESPKHSENPLVDNILEENTANSIIKHTNYDTAINVSKKIVEQPNNYFGSMKVFPPNHYNNHLFYKKNTNESKIKQSNRVSNGKNHLPNSLLLKILQMRENSFVMKLPHKSIIDPDIDYKRYWGAVHGEDDSSQDDYGLYEIEPAKLSLFSPSKYLVSRPSEIGSFEASKSSKIKSTLKEKNISSKLLTRLETDFASHIVSTTTNKQPKAQMPQSSRGKLAELETKITKPYISILPQLNINNKNTAPQSLELSKHPISQLYRSNLFELENTADKQHISILPQLNISNKETAKSPDLSKDQIFQLHPDNLADLETKRAKQNTSTLSRLNIINHNYTDSISETKYKDKSSKAQNTVQPVTSPAKNLALIIDTPGCKIPKMDRWDPSILHLIELHPPYVCSDHPSFLTPEPNGIIHLNISILEKYYNATPNDMKCWYQGISRKYEEPDIFREHAFATSKVFKLEFETPIEYDHAVVKCFFSNYTHEQYFPLPRIKKEVEEKRMKAKHAKPLSVLLLGIDSISKLNFLRHFRRTKAFMKANMNVYDMKGYAKVGDNTFPNLVPMLTGYFAEHIWNESIRDTFAFDNVSFIWKDYARDGYRTFFAEDAPYAGTFNYIKRGFIEQPTDYYYRPLALAIAQSELRTNHRLNKSPCLDHQLETELMFDYVKNFVKTMDKRPYFAFTMVSVLTHDFFNAASYVDVPALRLLEALQDAGALNNTALIMFSDHGLRYGDIRNTYIGKLEERMPFMYIHLPKWYLQENPELKKNLAINQDRLITLFDIHATLKHLLHLNMTFPEKTDELGLSLFREIPENRTCADANIKQHWCPCNNFKPVAVNSSFIISVSEAMVSYINKLLLSHADVCETLELEEITDAQMGQSNDLALKFERDENAARNQSIVLGDAPPIISDYLITLRTKPGGAIIEGSARYDDGRRVAKVIGVSRINKYGLQSWCIDSQSLKLYCYCKTQNNTQPLLFDYDFSN